MVIILIKYSVHRAQKPFSDKIYKNIVETDISSIKQKIVSKELQLKAKVNGKSNVWQSFVLVCDGEKELDYVACKQCNHVLCYIKGKTGTSTMSKHKCLKPKDQPVLSSFNSLIYFISHTGKHG